MKKNKLKNPHRDEAIKKWGKEAVEKSESKLLSLSKTDFQKLALEQADNWKELFNMRQEIPTTPYVQRSIRDHYKITSAFWARKPDAQEYIWLAESYLQDERYTIIEGQKYKDFAEFLYAAMRHYADNNL